MNDKDLAARLTEISWSLDYPDDLAAIEAANRLTALEAEVARLREALEEYGDHSPRCAWHADQPHNPTDCDCGYDTALAPAQKDGDRG